MLKSILYIFIILFVVVTLFLESTKSKRGRALLQNFCCGGLIADEKSTEKEKIYEFLKNMIPPPKEPIREEFDEEENSEKELEGEESEDDS